MSESAITISVDAAPFNRVVAQLAQISGRDFSDVLKQQAGAVLKNCIQHTPKASVDNIKKRANKDYVRFSTGEVISVWRRGNGQLMFLSPSNYQPPKVSRLKRLLRKTPKPPRLINGMSWHQMDAPNRHWSNTRWARFEDLYSQMDRIKAERLRAALEARGLTARSWLQCADDLGINTARLGAPAYVQNATPSNGASYKNGSGSEFVDAARALIEIFNDHPVLVDGLKNPSGETILQLAINSREAAFIKDVEKGVFDDIIQRAKRYPGIF